jgi:hypothetical protein
MYCGFRTNTKLSIKRRTTKEKRDKFTYPAFRKVATSLYSIKIELYVATIAAISIQNIQFFSRLNPATHKKRQKKAGTTTKSRPRNTIFEKTDNR